VTARLLHFFAENFQINNFNVYFDLIKFKSRLLPNISMQHDDGHDSLLQQELLSISLSISGIFFPKQLPISIY
jgi:hypothetical protein